MPSEKAVERVAIRIQEELENVVTGLDSADCWYALDRICAIKDVCQKILNGDEMAAADGLGDEGEEAMKWLDGFSDMCRHIEFSIARRKQAVAAERERCVQICRDHAADKNPPHKPHEDTYLDGWIDACNECGWAIEKGVTIAKAPNAALGKESGS